MSRLRLRLHLNLGLVCALLVLVPGLIGAELVTQGYERRLTEDVRTNATAGLDSLTGLFDVERTRTLNNAEVAGERLGPLVAAEMSSDDLVKAAADVRSTALRSTSLLAGIGGGGHTLASDPASNLPFGPQGDVKTAPQGRLSVRWQERGILVLEATSPLRDGGPMPGAAVAAGNLDDGVFDTPPPLTGPAIAILAEP